MPPSEIEKINRYAKNVSDVLKSTPATADIILEQASCIDNQSTSLFREKNTAPQSLVTSIQ
jgi:hypothetical protein